MEDLNNLLFLAQSVILISTKLKKEKRNRKLWSEAWLLRRNEGRGCLHMLKNELRVEDPESYKSFLRMCEEHFDELLGLIKNDVAKQDTNMRECVSPEQRLAVTLRFLATGETYRSLMYTTRIHESTISQIIPEVCNSIFNKLKDKYLKMPNTQKEWLEISAMFENMWNFPLCLGSIDGKHINFRPPRSAGSYYYNYKGHHSIVLLAACDATYKFIYVDVGVNGRISDGGVFRESSLKRAIDSNILAFPPNKKLPGQNTPIPYVFVADDAFPLGQRIMKPYPNRGLTIRKRIYNYRLSRARRVIENSFGILVNRFRILLNTINLAADKVESITLACCALHNFLATKNHGSYCDVAKKHPQIINLQHQQGGNRTTQETLVVRDLFCEYFNTNGSVPWQNECLG